ncbi:MAG: hypothetical protein HC831_02970 [Chloroflexia bacterium]|nr:hypothetical protein [Chloroflexia bacterium]
MFSDFPAWWEALSTLAKVYWIVAFPATLLFLIQLVMTFIGGDGRIAIGDSWADTEKTFDGDTWDQPLRGNFNQLLKLKQKFPHIQTLISVGGWV